MDVLCAVEAIKRKFMEVGSSAAIPLVRSGSFTAKIVEDGVMVDNLGSQPLLPWAVFQEAVCVMLRNGGRARRGDAMQSRLGDPGLSMDSVEGHIAQVVYRKKPGDSVFRRITPIACILIWAGVCTAERSKLILKTL